jgi:hypothetical protein
MNAQTFVRLHHAQVRSGISIAAFCRKRGLALSTYHYWRRQYGSVPAADGFVEVQLSELPQPAPPTPPVLVEPPIGLLYRGASLSLPVGFSPSTLRQCLEVLREALPC